MLANHQPSRLRRPTLLQHRNQAHSPKRPARLRIRSSLLSATSIRAPLHKKKDTMWKSRMLFPNKRPRPGAAHRRAPLAPPLLARGIRAHTAVHLLQKQKDDACMANMQIRPARPEDGDVVLPFCQDTWEWGDYIDRVWDGWLAEQDGRLFTATVD